MKRFPAIAFALLILQLLAGWSAANDAVYQRVKRSTVWIVSPDLSSGSGVLVDADRRLVVTNAHVVGNNRYVAVFAPVHDSSGDVWQRNSYLGETQRLGQLGYATTGEVVAYSSVTDLAVVRLQTDLQGMSEIQIADEDPQAGDGLHVVGNPAERPLFSYSYGGTRFVGHTSWTYKDGHYVSAEVIQFSSHVWFGNSGGPVANDQGELVGVITGSGQTTATAISRIEIERLVGTVKWKKVFSLHNETRGELSFAVRTSADGDWENATLAAGYYHIWWGDDIGDVEIAFDSSYSAGYQGQEYRLDTYYTLLGDGVSAKPEQGRQYAFRATYGGLDLYAR